MCIRDSLHITRLTHITSHIAFLHMQSALRKNVRHQGVNTQNKRHIIFIADRRKELVKVCIRVALQNRLHKHNPLRSRSQILSNVYGLNLVHELEELLTSTTLEVRHLNLVDRRVILCWIGSQLRVVYKPLAYAFSSYLISGIGGTTGALEVLLEERTTFILTP